MGIAVISSYRGGYNFEAVGLSRALVNDLFPGMPAKISGEGYASLHSQRDAAPRSGLRQRRRDAADRRLLPPARTAARPMPIRRS